MNNTVFQIKDLLNSIKNTRKTCFHFVYAEKDLEGELQIDYTKEKLETDSKETLSKLNAFIADPVYMELKNSINKLIKLMEGVDNSEEYEKESMGLFPGILLDIWESQYKLMLNPKDSGVEGDLKTYYMAFFNSNVPEGIIDKIIDYDRTPITSNFEYTEEKYQ
mgnify:CR=1 FL=1